VVLEWTLGIFIVLTQVSIDFFFFFFVRIVLVILFLLANEKVYGSMVVSETIVSQGLIHHE
jgi:hypothetical protein